MALRKQTTHKKDTTVHINSTEAHISHTQQPTSNKLPQSQKPKTIKHIS